MKFMSTQSKLRMPGKEKEFKEDITVNINYGRDHTNFQENLYLNLFQTEICLI